MRAVLIGTAAAGACIAGATALPRQQEAAPAPQGMSKQELARMIAQMSAPGEGHKALEVFVGEADAETTLVMGPGAPPLTVRTVMHGEWVLGGRFVRIVSRPAEGEELPAESISYFGYDTRRGAYFWWGMDTMGTYGVYAQGEYDPATRTFTLLGENEEPGMGVMKFRNTITQHEDGTRSASIHFQAPEAMRPMLPPGTADAEGWFPVMTMTSRPRP